MGKSLEYKISRGLTPFESDRRVVENGVNKDQVRRRNFRFIHSNAI